KIRELMDEANKQYDLQNYSDAVDIASEGMDKVIEFIEGAVIGHFPQSVSGIAVADAFHVGRDGNITRDDYLSNEERGIFDTLKKMREILFYLALEMKIGELVRYREVVGNTY